MAAIPGQKEEKRPRHVMWQGHLRLCAVFTVASEEFAPYYLAGIRHDIRQTTGLAEFERELIRERARVGRDAAQKRGVRFGRPPKLNTIQRALANRLLSEGQLSKTIIDETR